MTKELLIGKHKVDKLLVNLYIDHFARDKTNIMQWEKQRKVLHDNIFAMCHLDRFSHEGQEFSKELDKYCEPKIATYDVFAAGVKKLARAETQEEIEIATKRLQFEMQKRNYSEAQGFREKPVAKNGINHCRICSKELGKGIPRINDHMATVRGFNEIDLPICGDCSDNNPDEYHSAFRRQYWKH